jgi:hypothetical protein
MESPGSARRFLLPAAHLAAPDDLPLKRGAREVGANGTNYVTHDSPEDPFGVICLRGGYYVAKTSRRAWTRRCSPTAEHRTCI